MTTTRDRSLFSAGGRWALAFALVAGILVAGAPAADAAPTPAALEAEIRSFLDAERQARGLAPLPSATSSDGGYSGTMVRASTTTGRIVFDAMQGTSRDSLLHPDLPALGVEASCVGDQLEVSFTIYSAGSSVPTGPSPVVTRPTAGSHCGANSQPAPFVAPFDRVASFTVGDEMGDTTTFCLFTSDCTPPSDTRPYDIVGHDVRYSSGGVVSGTVRLAGPVDDGASYGFEITARRDYTQRWSVNRGPDGATLTRDDEEVACAGLSAAKPAADRVSISIPDSCLAGAVPYDLKSTAIHSRQPEDGGVVLTGDGAPFAGTRLSGRLGGLVREGTPGLPAGQARDTSATCGSAPPSGFRDVADDNVHRRNIDCIKAHGVTSGKTADTYDPFGGLPRDQLARFLVNTLEAAGVTLPPASRSYYSDVPSSNPHAEAIGKLAEAGILPTAGDRLVPKGYVTRGEMAMLTARAARHAGATLSDAREHFLDDDAHPGEGDIDGLTAAGVVTGRGERLFAPADTLRRDQMATFLARLLDLLES